MSDARRRAAACALGVLALAAVILLVPAGRRPMWSQDEARQALLGQDILDHGRWLVPDLRGRPYMNKPQLFFWSIALASLPAGRVTEFTAAIPAVMSALAGVAGVIAIGTLLWGWRAGALAGLMLITTLCQFEIGHQVLPDVMLNAWLVWTLYWLLRAQRAGWASGPLIAFYACIAGGVMTKGPPALAALPAAAVAVALTEGHRTLRRLASVPGLAILAAVTLTWLVPYYTHSRGAFTGEVLRGHYLTWFFRGGILGRAGNVVSALPDFLPWLIWLGAAALWWRRAPDPARRRVGLWTLTLWLVIGMSGTFRSRYLLPIYPGLALLTAEFLAAAPREGARRLLRASTTATGVLAMAVAVAVTSPLLRLAAEGEKQAYVPEAWWETAAIAALAMAAGVVLVVAARRNAFAAGAVAFGLALGGILIVEGITYPARYARAYDVRALASVAASHAPPGASIIAHPEIRLSYDFYLRRPVIEISSPEVLASRMADASADVVITTRERWNRLAPGLPPAWRVLASASVAEREMVVLGRRPR
jgi:4-amino-4-deoxy-L-arabinose transferase-like glycosyltransferase